MIDSHMHIFMRREHFPDDYIWNSAWRASRRELPFKDPDQLTRDVKKDQWVPDGSKWLMNSEYCGIDIGVNTPNDYPGAREGYGSLSPDLYRRYELGNVRACQAVSR